MIVEAAKSKLATTPARTGRKPGGRSLIVPGAPSPGFGRRLVAGLQAPGDPLCDRG